MATPTIQLSFEAIDDLIYSARVGDIENLKAEIAKLSQEHNCSPGAIIESAIDMEDESEGGTGACLLHWPAANGNTEILKYLLECLGSTTAAANYTPRSPLLNHQNHAGNTPLHWAALNTHLDCVKALVEAGADVGAKNSAGHDAAFLAERTEWSGQGDDDGQAGGDEDEATDQAANAQPPESEGMRVVELLLERTEGDGGAPGDADVGSGENQPQSTPGTS